MTGFFPIMMFALPAAALAIWHTAKPSQKKAGRRHHALGRAVQLPHRRHRAAGVRVHVRGVPALRHPRAAHRHVDGADQRARIKDGFGFSAGFFDYALNFNIATNPLWLIPIGLGYAVVYYFLFRFVIQKWNLRTPGREEDDEEQSRRSRPVADRTTACCWPPAAWSPRRAPSRRGGCRSTAPGSRRSAPGEPDRARRRRPARRHRGARLRRHPRARRGRGLVRRGRPGGGGPGRGHPPRPRHDHDAREPGHRHPGRRWPPRRDGSRRSSPTALLAGIHLEGPWLSERYAGRPRPGAARDARPPSWSTGWSRRATATLRMATIAPELPGGVDAVRRLTAAGVVAAIGHTDATYDQARAALDAGAAVGTHLFNAMRALHHREPGPVAALLEHPDAYVELIADGVHVHPAMVRPRRGGQAAAHGAGDRRDGGRGRGRRRLPARAARRDGPRRGGAAGVRGDRRLHGDHGLGGALRRTTGRAEPGGRRPGGDRVAGRPARAGPRRSAAARATTPTSWCSTTTSTCSG